MDFLKPLFTGRNVIGFSNFCPQNNEARYSDHNPQKQFQNSVSKCAKTSQIGVSNNGGYGVTKS